VKLVRDFIPAIIEESGRSCKYHSADLAELESRLYDKMIEEMNEFKENPCSEEAADMLEVFQTLCWVHRIPLEEIENIGKNKRKVKGGFLSGLILEEVSNEKHS